MSKLLTEKMIKSWFPEAGKVKQSTTSVGIKTLSLGKTKNGKGRL